jgi:hypothetical protein
VDEIIGYIDGLGYLRCRECMERSDPTDPTVAWESCLAVAPVRIEDYHDEPCETCGEKLMDRPECAFSDCTNKVMKSIELKTSKGKQVLLSICSECFNKGRHLEAGGKQPYVTVAGKGEFNWTVELPLESCREPVMCDDPAVEAAIQAVSQSLTVYLWGQDEPPAIVYTEIDERDVEVEDDDRE